MKDEEIFASKFVHCMDMIIDLCVADTEKHARPAAQLVQIAYEELTLVILTIEHESYLGSPDQQEKCFNKSDYIIEGSFYIGTQEHFLYGTKCLSCTTN